MKRSLCLTRRAEGPSPRTSSATSSARWDRTRLRQRSTRSRQDSEEEMVCPHLLTGIWAGSARHGPGREEMHGREEGWARWAMSSGGSSAGGARMEPCSPGTEGGQLYLRLGWYQRRALLKCRGRTSRKGARHALSSSSPHPHRTASYEPLFHPRRDADLLPFP